MALTPVVEMAINYHFLGALIILSSYYYIIFSSHLISSHLISSLNLLQFIKRIKGLALFSKDLDQNLLQPPRSIVLSENYRLLVIHI